MKISNPYFLDIPEYGDLTMEYIIVEYSHPILFVLLDEIGHRYLCVCCDIRTEQRWIVNRIKCEDLLKLFSNDLSLEDAFKIGEHKKVVAVRNYQNKRESYRLVDFGEIDNDDLPVPGEFLDAEEGEYEEYIAFLIKSDGEL